MAAFNDKENSSWAEYSKLVINSIENLQENQKTDKREMNEKLDGIYCKLNEITSIQKDLHELKTWKDKVQEIWSVSQMKESKDEVYRQKNKWFIVIGVLTALQVLWAIFTFFKKNII